MIPAAFEENMRAFLGRDANEFLAALREEPVRGIRLTPGKAAPLPPGTGEPVVWFPGMYYLSADSAAGKLPLHEAGAYYLQEPSAAAPPAVLHPRSSERVLDLCAAPGGKATALAALAPNALVVANEIMPDRARILSSNVERLGCANMIVVNESPERLAGQWPGEFDAVLVDAPCSGEGMFRRHPETVEEWTPDSPRTCARRQKAILDSAARLVKPGGRLCYSTCTFNRFENEEQIADFLDAHPDFEPADFVLPGVGASEQGCLRLWPHRCAGEGHFVALMHRKPGDTTPKAQHPPLGGLPAPDRETRKAADTLLAGLLNSPVRADAEFNGGLWQLPPMTPDLRGLRLLRPGLRLLHRQQRLLLPDHALSHAAEARRKVSLDDEQVLRYLHGETISLDNCEDGWCQVCVQGVPLGWGKMTQGTLKNHYPKGLRK